MGAHGIVVHPAPGASSIAARAARHWAIDPGRAGAVNIHEKTALPTAGPLALHRRARGCRTRVSGLAYATAAEGPPRPALACTGLLPPGSPLSLEQAFGAPAWEPGTHGLQVPGIVLGGLIAHTRHPKEPKMSSELPPGAAANAGQGRTQEARQSCGGGVARLSSVRPTQAESRSRHQPAGPPDKHAGRRGHGSGTKERAQPKQLRTKASKLAGLSAVVLGSKVGTSHTWDERLGVTQGPAGLGLKIKLIFEHRFSCTGRS